MQPQGQVQVLAHVVDGGLDPQAALEAAGLRVFEHPLPPGELGAGQLIRVHDDGWLEGGADSRRDGVAFGA